MGIRGKATPGYTKTKQRFYLKRSGSFDRVKVKMMYGHGCNSQLPNPKYTNPK